MNTHLLRLPILRATQPGEPWFSPAPGRQAMRGSSVSSQACPVPGLIYPRPISSSGRRQDRRWLPRSPAGQRRPSCMLPSSPRRPGHKVAAGPGRGRAPNFSGPGYMEWSNGIIGSADDASDMRRRMGAAALELDASDGSSSARWRDVVASRLPSQHWPQQPVLIAAVDAHSGEPVVFDRHSGIDLVDAVAASTSAMTPYRIGANRYINGGYRRSENADLRLDTGGCWCSRRSPAGRGCLGSGAWTWLPKSPNCGQGAAGSKLSFRMAARGTCSVPTRWIHQRVRRPRGEATTKAGPSRNCSPDSGSDASAGLGRWPSPADGGRPPPGRGPHFPGQAA